MRRFIVAIAGGFTAAIVFMIVGPGIAAVLMGLGVDRTVAAIIGVACWYGLRYLAQRHLKNRALAASGNGNLEADNHN